MTNTAAVTHLALIDSPAPDLLTGQEEAALQRCMEAGIAAQAALDGVLTAPAGATEPELLEIVAAGDRARIEFAQANTGLVWWVVAPIARSTGHDRTDLFQEGVLGLMEAIQRFDSARGRFGSYAVPRIRMRAWDAAVTGGGTLGMSARRARQWRKIRLVASQLTLTLERTPSAEEVAAATGDSVSVVQALLLFEPPTALSMDTPGWENLLVADPQVDAPDEVDQVGVRRLLRRLSDRDRMIVVSLFGLSGPAQTHAEVARVLGRSESTVRRRERLALTLLRAGTENSVAA